MRDTMEASLAAAWRGVSFAMEKRERRGEEVEVEARRLTYVLGELLEEPWTTASEISTNLRLSREDLLVAFKCLQRADGLPSLFSESIHRDYFNVVRHYFNTRHYTLVFFVGQHCPSRCVFCPNVTVHDDGRRSLTTYGKGMVPMDPDTVSEVFEELEILQGRGDSILVKISGGLEPLTDLETMVRIGKEAQKRAIPVKLFTNGILLNTDERRRVALLAGDIRISLSTADPHQYEEINFGQRGQREPRRLGHLCDNLTRLMAMRNETGAKTKVGFNAIIMRDNCDQVIPMMQLARRIGLDYIDFKPDYFGSVTEAEQARINETVAEAKELASKPEWKDMNLFFAGSLDRKHLYWRSWRGGCDAGAQAHYKMFITPFGHMSPVHYGAFPKYHSAEEPQLSKWSVGRLDGTNGFLDAMIWPIKLPELSMRHLNPFELMLSLEIQREQQDKAWGIPVSCSPYHTSLKEVMPRELNLAWHKRRAHGS